MNASSHFADLVMVNDSYRRGDLQAAAGRALSTLNAVVNPGSGNLSPSPAVTLSPGLVGGRFGGPTGQPTGEDWDALFGELEATAEYPVTALTSTADPSRVDAPNTAIDPETVMQIIQLAVQIFKRLFNRNRPAPQFTASAGPVSDPANPATVPVNGPKSGPVGSKVTPTPTAAPKPQ